jgi:hypothetical protein
MIVRLNTFSGIVPRLGARQLPEGTAQVAYNCDFSAGTIRGLNDKDPIAGIGGAGIKSIYVHPGGTSYGNTFCWTTEVDAVVSPVVNDQYGRFYWANGTNFYVSRVDGGGTGGVPQYNRQVGVPQPAALTISASEFSFPGLADASSTTSLNDIYAHTSVSIYDERADGTLDNQVSILTPSWATTPTSATCTFTARAPHAIDNKSTSTQQLTLPDNVSGLQVWGQCRLAEWVAPSPGASLGLVATNQTLMVYQFPIPWNTAFNATCIYYSADVMPDFMHVMYSLDGGNTYTQESGVYRHRRLMQDGSYVWTNWYSTVGNNPQFDSLVPTWPGSTKSTTTASDSPFVGPLVQVDFTKASGGKYSAKIRPDSASTTLPEELAGMTAKLTVTGTSYSISFTASTASQERRAYTYTYVNSFGEEGPPAPPTEVDASANASTVRIAYSLPTGSYQDISKLRLYRTAAGASASYLYVGEYALSGGSPYITDTLRSSQLGHTLDTMNYYPPPQTLVGICTMANGIMAGFRGNEVWFSEPYLPYAWNPSAAKAFPHAITGICPFEGGLYVTTTAYPYIVTGAAPEYMTDAKVPAIQAGVHRRAIVNAGPYVVYASNDGLVMARGLDASLDISQKFFTRQDWRARWGNNLNNIRLNVHDGCLLIWFANGAQASLLRMDDAEPYLTDLAEGYTAAFPHPTADALYISNGSSIYAFRAATTRMSPVWQSKEFVSEVPISFAALQLFGTGYAQVQVFAGGNLISLNTLSSLTLTGSTVMRLPSGTKYRQWSVYIVGNSTTNVEEVVLATSMAELKSV